MTKIRFKDYLIDYLKYFNISNKDFANRIGVTPKHLSSILSGESDLSSQVITNISFITNIPKEYIYTVEDNYKLELKIESFLEKEEISLADYLKKFKYKDLIKNKYIKFLNPSDNMIVAKDILRFLRVSSPDKIYELENEGFYKSKNNKPELLLLWLEKCYRKTLNQTVKKYKKENIDILVNYILACATKGEFNEDELKEKFNENGIFLVIKDDLPGTKIRGVFKVLRNTPAIYITRKHKRIADIYFSLLHELAHCKTDFNAAKSMSFITTNETASEIEKKADKTAYNWMVNDKYYYDVCLKEDYKIELENNFPKSFVLYRLASDKKIKYSDKNYQKYNFIL